MFEDRLQALESDIGAERAYAMALRQFELDEERKRQSGPGGLMHFIRYFWRHVEPTKKFVEGWALEAMCKHLEAVDEGRIQKLLITVPPGAMKSLLCSVFFPLWQWGPRAKAEQRFLNFAYAAHLPQRDNGRMLQILQTKEWRELWGKRRYRDADGTLLFAGFELAAEGKEKIATSKTGWKFATSVGGVGTGERADCVICFPADQMVATEHGLMPIGDIVRERRDVRVWARCAKTGHKELRRIVEWRHNPGSPIVEVVTKRGTVRATPDHRIWTRRGWVEASALASPGGMRVSAQAVAVPQFKVEMLPCAFVPNAGNSLMTHAEHRAQLGGCMVVHACDQSNHVFGQMMGAILEAAVSFAVGNILRAGTIFKVVQAWIGSIVIAMANLLSGWTWPHEGRHDHLMDEAVFGLASCFGEGDARIPLIKSGRHEFGSFAHDMSGCGIPCSVMIERGASFPWHDALKCPDAPVIGDQILCFEADNRHESFIAVDEVRYVGHEDETFCLEIEGFHTFYCGSPEGLYLVSNCDDPHSIKDDTSEVVRPETVRWFKEAMSNRLNDMERSSIIAIMQRSHEADVAGTILDDDMGYVHLNIPMEYEADQHCTTYTDDGELFWTDPRKVEGECFWPERFPPRAVADIKKLGPHVVISQYQQRPEPRGGAIIKRAYWRNYEPKLKAGKPQWPEFEYTVVSIDSAFTEKTENDPTGCSVWGVWQNPEGSMCVMLLNAWRKWLTLNGTARRKLKTESWGDYRAETEETWGLVQWTRYECSRHKADALLIENKANGIDLQNEVIRLSQHDPWSIVMIDPKNLDKIARLRRIESVFAEGLVYAILEKAYAKLAIDEMAAAPRGRFRDVTDSASQCINYLRKCGYLEHVDVFKERQVREQERRGKKPRGAAPLYPA